MTDNRQLSVSEAAELIGISRQAVLKAIKDRRLSAKKIGNQWVIDRQEVGDYLNKRRGNDVSKTNLDKTI